MYYSDKFVVIETQANGSVLTAYTGYDPTEKEFDQYLEAYKRTLDESPAFVQVFDATLSKNLRSELRLKQSKWIEQNRKLLADRVKHAIFVIPSMFVRIVLNGIFALSKPPYPYTVVSSMEEATRLIQSSKL
jgi:hypothetical protein